MKQGNQVHKGKAFERKVVRLAKEYGVPAVRLAPLQAGNPSYCDVMLDSWFTECKHHRRVPVNRLAGFTDREQHVLVWQDNGKRPKVVLDLLNFLELIQRVNRLSGSVPVAQVSQAEVEGG